MGFDANGFLNAALTRRTRALRVPELADWFDGEPVWTVRGVDSNELARAEAAKSSLKREAALAQALTSGSAAAIIREAQAALGRAKEVEPDTARRLHLLTSGSVEPACPMELAVRVAEHYPVTFYSLTNAILELTGQGSDVEKKPPSSGTIPASEAP